MSNRLLVIGASGMLGGSLFRYFTSQPGFEVLGTVRSQNAARHLMNQGFENLALDVDVSNDEKVQQVIEAFKPNYVFNCVGLIKQLDDSKKPVAAIEINSLLPHKLASFSKSVSAKLIHFSTDCVFTGSRGGYLESDVPDASDIYGRSKLLGEVDYDGHLTLRTSIIGHENTTNYSLVDWFLSQEGTVKGFAKAVFSGLPTVVVAEFVHQYVINGKDISGLFHLSVEPIDKYTLLHLVKEIYGVSTEIVKDNAFAIDRSLNSDLLRQATGFSVATWPELIKRMHDEHQQYFA